MSKHRDQIVRAARTYTEVDYTSRGGGSRVGLYVMADGSGVGEFVVVGRRNAFLHAIGDLSKSIDEALFKMESLQEGDSVSGQDQVPQ